MSRNFNRAARTMALAFLVCCMIVPALAQEQPSDDAAVNGPAIGRYAVLPLRLLPGYATATAGRSLKDMEWFVHLP